MLFIVPHNLLHPLGHYHEVEVLAESMKENHKVHHHRQFEVPPVCEDSKNHQRFIHYQPEENEDEVLYHRLVSILVS